jgi:hypothetical protein
MKMFALLPLFLLSMTLGSLASAQTPPPATNNEKKVTVKKAKPVKKPAAPVEETVESAESSPASQLQKNAITFELLGRGVAYSFNYDYLILDNFGLGAGLSYYGSGSANLLIIPVYGNFYPLGERHRLLLTAGPTFLTFSGKTSNDSIKASGVAFNAGVGYEFRGESGFIFRATPYVYFGQISTAWLGLSFGYAF